MWVKQQQCCVLIVSCDWTLFPSAHSYAALCWQKEGGADPWPLCILVGQADARQGRKKQDTRDALGRSVFPRTLGPPDMLASLAAATQECDEFHSQWLNKPVTLGGADGREVERQKESQSGTQQRSFPVCLDPCWVMVEGVAPKCFWKLLSDFGSFMKAGIAPECAPYGSSGSRKEEDDMEGVG